MKQTFILLIALLGFTHVSHAQGRKAKEMLKEIKSQWEVDDNGNITYSKIIEAPGLDKATIYQRALNYFTYNYGSGKSVIEAKDKEDGIIVAKGLYNKVHIGNSLITIIIDTWHIIRVDIKEGRARVIITLTRYEKEVRGGDTPPSHGDVQISREYPINPKGMFKTVMGKAFAKSHKKAMQSIDKIEKAIIEGNTTNSIEGEDW